MSTKGSAVGVPGPPGDLDLRGAARSWPEGVLQASTVLG